MAEEKAEARVHRSDLKRESASFVPNVVLQASSVTHLY